MIKAPFTPEQVAGLNEYQKAQRYHPFTCGAPDFQECQRRKKENEGILIASESGWVCPCGKYTQNWAHSFMANTIGGIQKTENYLAKKTKQMQSYILNDDAVCQESLNEFTRHWREGLELKKLKKGDRVNKVGEVNNFFGSFIKVEKGGDEYTIESSKIR